MLPRMIPGPVRVIDILMVLVPVSSKPLVMLSVAADASESSCTTVLLVVLSTVKILKAFVPDIFDVALPAKRMVPVEAASVPLFTQSE